MKVALLLLSLLLQAPAGPRGSVNGTVTVAGTAQPIADAEIAILSPAGLIEATTDSNGRFSLANVPAGRHTVIIRADGYFAAPLAPNAIPPARVEVPVTVAQDAVSVSTAMIQGAIVAGRIFDLAGRPLPFAVVQAYHTDSKQVVAARPTDDQGEYRLFWLPPGEYVIGVNPRILPANLALSSAGEPPQPVRTLFPGTTDLAQATRIALRPGEELKGIDISARLDVVTPQATPAPAISPLTGGGIKVSGQITNALMPTTGNAVLLIGSAAETAAPRQVGNVNLNAETVPFEIPSVPPGKYELFLRMADPRGSLGAGGATQVWGRATIQVQDSNVEGVVMTIHPSVDVPGVLKIDGVTAPAGGSLKVGLSVLGIASSIANYRGILDRAQIPGDGGRVSIPGAAEGNYDVTVQGLPANAYVADIRQGERSVLAAGVEVRDVVPAAFEVLVATNGGTVEGVAQLGPAPGAGATVILVPDNRELLRHSRILTAGPDGRFSIAGIRPGEYKLFAIPGPLTSAQLTPQLVSKYDGKSTNVSVKAAATTKADVPVITD